VVEEFLEDINNILNSGEVPNLFEADEFERNIIACRPAAKDAGLPEGNRDAIYDFFINRVRCVDDNDKRVLPKVTWEECVALARLRKNVLTGYNWTPQIHPQNCPFPFDNNHPI